MAIEDAETTVVGFATMAEEIALRLAPVVAELQGVLDGLAGRSFGSLESNQAVARGLVALLNRLGMRVECPGCGEPAILRCAAMSRMPEGSFQFEHAVSGRPIRHRASPVLPRLKLVLPPPDRRRLSGTISKGK